ncbi:uncharacterized protein LOC102482823 [Tupaia chinensis]|uniref:G-protein coupled receptors family 1 profile domain-containing protein n=1 Tax=Tupaia chinensis TaxID=246437 RepID=L8Y464_TUPCH|nr:uncharacterized protein LOC102482823 [Tupaia chinensis]ELV11027.1 hypothetical protein TREES_T100012631 [Tupaia chinensis]
MDSHNMSWIQYPSHVSPAVEEVIATQSTVSRCMHIYVALFVPVSLAAGLLNFTTFMRNRSRLQALDMLLLDLAVTNVLVTLLSLSAAGRPDYLLTTNLCCGFLSFLSNICYFNAQYLQVAMLLKFSLLGSLPCLTRTQRPAVVLVAILGCAFCSSLVVVSLLGTSGELYKTIMCQMDLLTAWPEYEIVKFSLGFGFALVLKLVFFFLVIVKLAWQAVPLQRDMASAYLVVWAIALTMFACRLFYNIILLQRARLKLQRDIGSPRDELLMNLAELVLFGESCVNSLATLFLHEPCRLALLNMLECLTLRCRKRQADNSISLKRVGS